MKSDKTKGFLIEVITDQVPEISHHLACGYGVGASATRLTGKTHEVTIAKDGDPLLSISITKEGHIHLTNCGGMFSFLFGTNISLTNTRPWKEAK